MRSNKTIFLVYKALKHTLGIEKLNYLAMQMEINLSTLSTYQPKK